MMFMWSTFLDLETKYTLVILLISAILNIASLIIAWHEFFNYREFIDPLFEKKESRNVIGTFKPKGETKKIIIFSGHHDSARQFNLLHYLKVGYIILIFIGLGVFYIWSFISFVLVILTLFKISLEFLTPYLFALFIISIPSLIGMLLFVWPGERANTVPGAIDNLSAVSVILCLGRVLRAHEDLIPENTEIRIISFGCEEAGLRGAYRYAKAHHKELTKLSTEVVNMDMISIPEVFTIMAYEPTTRTKHSMDVVEKIKKAASAAGLKSRVLGLTNLEKVLASASGGTDAAAFSKAGIKAASFGSFDLKDYFKFYHQPADNIDKIKDGALLDALKILINYIINEKGTKSG